MGRFLGECVEGMPWIPDQGRVTYDRPESSILTIGVGEAGFEVLDALTAMPLPPARYFLVDPTGDLALDAALVKRIIASSHRTTVLIVGALPDDTQLCDWLENFLKALREAWSRSVALLLNNDAAKGIGFDLVVNMSSSEGSENAVEAMVNACLAIKSIDHSYQLVGVDTDDFNAIIGVKEYGWIASASASGTHKCSIVAEDVIASMLAQGVELERITAAWISVSGPTEKNLTYLNGICSAIQAALPFDTNFGFGYVQDGTDDSVKVTCWWQPIHKT